MGTCLLYTSPYVGLNFGAFYLSEQLRAFDGHVHAALAAYNAGPGNAARWYETAAGDHDRFFDTVDFTETRLYIERIYEGFNAYRHLYGAVSYTHLHRFQTKICVICLICGSLS